jgi:hypothetical protein
MLQAHRPVCKATKKPSHREGLFRHLDFFDCDLMRSSSCKNSAVSSSIVLGGGLGGKGITSDMGRTSLVMPAQAPRSPLQLAHFCGTIVVK